MYSKTNEFQHKYQIKEEIKHNTDNDIEMKGE